MSEQMGNERPDSGAPAPVLSMRTAKCEGCGCDWTHPCLLGSDGSVVQVPVEDTFTKQGVPLLLQGCHWDMEFWKQGRAVCSLCVTQGKVAA